MANILIQVNMFRHDLSITSKLSDLKLAPVETANLTMILFHASSCYPRFVRTMQLIVVVAVWHGERLVLQHVTIAKLPLQPQQVITDKFVSHYRSRISVKFSDLLS